MAQVYGEQLSGPGAYLLGILGAEGSVPFSRFYNDDTDYAALAAAAGVHESHTDQAHILIEFAAGQLERAGVVLFTPLDETLIDGEHDYLISLTDRGRDLIAGVGRFRYRDMDL